VADSQVINYVRTYAYLEFRVDTAKLAWVYDVECRSVTRPMAVVVLQLLQRPYIKLIIAAIFARMNDLIKPENFALSKDDFEESKEVDVPLDEGNF